MSAGRLLLRAGPFQSTQRGHSHRVRATSLADFTQNGAAFHGDSKTCPGRTASDRCLRRTGRSGQGQPSGRSNGQKYLSACVSTLKSSGAVRGTALRAQPVVNSSLLTGRITKSPGNSVRPLGSDRAASRPWKATSGPRTSSRPRHLTFFSITHGTQPKRRSISPSVSRNLSIRNGGIS